MGICNCSSLFLLSDSFGFMEAFEAFNKLKDSGFVSTKSGLKKGNSAITYTVNHVYEKNGFINVDCLVESWDYIGHCMEVYHDVFGLDNIAKMTTI